MVEVWFLSKVEHQVRNHNVIAKKTRGFLNIWSVLRFWEVLWFCSISRKAWKYRASESTDGILKPFHDLAFGPLVRSVPCCTTEHLIRKSRRAKPWNGRELRFFSSFCVSILIVAETSKGLFHNKIRTASPSSLLSFPRHKRRQFWNTVSDHVCFSVA